jgi:hypothetical protein
VSDHKDNPASAPHGPFDELLRGHPPAITDDQVEGFEKAAAPLIAWLANYGNPHASAIVTSVGAELLAGLTAFRKG